MITPFDIILFCLIGLALGISKQPKKNAILACIGILVLIWGYNIILMGEQLFWAIAATEVIGGYLLWWITSRLPVYQDRVFYRAMASFLWGSCMITGLYLYDVGLWASYDLYVATSHAIAIAHTAFMLLFADGTTDVIARTVHRINHRVSSAHSRDIAS